MVATPNTSSEQKKTVTDIFSLLGHCEIVEDENFVNCNTTYCGCGIAYVSFNLTMWLSLCEVNFCIDVFGPGGIR